MFLQLVTSPKEDLSLVEWLANAVLLSATAQVHAGCCTDLSTVTVVKEISGTIWVGHAGRVTTNDVEVGPCGHSGFGVPLNLQ